MEIVAIIICCLVSLAVNFMLVSTACALAIKNASKTLISIIEECEKADKSELFMETWKNRNR